MTQHPDASRRSPTRTSRTTTSQQGAVRAARDARCPPRPQQGQGQGRAGEAAAQRRGLVRELGEGREGVLHRPGDLDGRRPARGCQPRASSSRRSTRRSSTPTEGELVGPVKTRSASTSSRSRGHPGGASRLEDGASRSSSSCRPAAGCLQASSTTSDRWTRAPSAPTTSSSTAARTPERPPPDPGAQPASYEEQGGPQAGAGVRGGPPDERAPRSAVRARSTRGSPPGPGQPQGPPPGRAPASATPGVSARRGPRSAPGRRRPPASLPGGAAPDRRRAADGRERPPLAPPRRDHPPAAARVPLGPRAGRALDRPPHRRGGLRACRRGRAPRRRRSCSTSSATSSSRSTSWRCCSRSATRATWPRSPSTDREADPPPPARLR